MEIISIDLLSISASGFCHNIDDINCDCVKSLPVLSVVQSVSGSYDIAVDKSKWHQTGVGGVFIAPSGAIQKIRHHNGTEGKMEARWAFLDVIVNKHYRLEDLFAFPILMPAPYLEKAGDMIEIIRTAPDLAERYAAAYTLISILMRIGTPRRLPDQTFRMIRQFVEENYPAKISAKEIAAYVHCSPTQVFRYTKKYFGLTPANYVNAIRLQKAAALIESTDQKIGDIAYDTGFDDPAYFSKLFKGAFHFSPQKYRKIYRGL